MLAIVLLILKIIGITLAVILALAVLLVLILLFVPIKYNIRATYYDSVPKAEVRLSALLRLIRFRLVYENALWYRAKVLFITVYSSERNKEKEEQDGSRRKRKKKADTGKRKKKKEQSVFDEEEEDAKAVCDKKEAAADMVSGASAKAHSGSLEEEGSLEEKSTQSDSQSEEEMDTNADKDAGSGKKTVNPFVKFYNKAAELWKKIKEAIFSAKEKLLALWESIRTKKEDISGKIAAFYETINDVDNREFVRFLWEQVKIFLKAVKPKKGSLYLHYGMDDPETTGKIAMYMAVLYGLMGININIFPDFEQKVMEGELQLKGGLRLWCVLVITLKVYWNKQFKKLVLKK